MSNIYKDFHGFSYSSNTDEFVLSRDNLRKLDPKVYEKAAVRICTRKDDYSCYALEHVTDDYFSPEAKAFKANFGPTSVVPVVFSNHPFWSKEYTNKRKQDRMTSLAMMAAIVRDAKANRGKKKPKVGSATLLSATTVSH